MKEFQGLEKRIGYRFKDKQLLKASLTHPSYRYENPDVESDNQRLEFLGDSVLGLLAADALMKVHPEAPEGELTKFKSALASGASLARVAADLDLGGSLRMGRGEEAAGGAERESNLEDALEALIGAIWMDGGLKAVRRFFDRHIFQVLENTEPAMLNPKGTLQEFAQKKGFGIPEYSVVEESGPDHDRRFKVKVTVSTFVFRGDGRSRREAEKVAAEKAVRSLVQ
ncbi:ribonuclease III [Tichowtungia aerotolerans]|uniref:Ribonuclease 3 n=1 Tax=Tichowtungia aerotolerans TaxID=2697043 RepID=A0A6P1MBX3_9BACT|nr:ribonuclease III [Tichowtungia aerotolerans]QHI70603.1 ribonuclease III [Tichowtungia aerotolerans]